MLICWGATQGRCRPRWVPGVTAGATTGTYSAKVSTGLRGCWTAIRSARDSPIRASSTSATSTTACREASGSRRSWPRPLAGDRGVRPQRLVHHRGGVRGQRVLGREHRSSIRSPGRSPQRRRSAAGITRYGLAGTVTMPPGSRRATTTPAAAVRVNRSPGCQPSALVIARSATRPQLVHPAGPVHHVIRDRRDFRRGGNRQPAGSRAACSSDACLREISLFGCPRQGEGQSPYSTALGTSNVMVCYDFRGVTGRSQGIIRYFDPTRCPRSVIIKSQYVLEAEFGLDGCAR